MREEAYVVLAAVLKLVPHLRLYNSVYSRSHTIAAQNGQVTLNFHTRKNIMSINTMVIFGIKLFGLRCLLS